MDNDFFELEQIKVMVNGNIQSVCVMDYVDAKTKDLKEFGYTSLTEESVTKSVKRILNREKLIDVIDHFIKDDIVLD